MTDNIAGRYYLSNFLLFGPFTVRLFLFADACAEEAAGTDGFRRPFFHNTRKLFGCDGNYRTVARMEVHGDVRINNLEIFKVGGFCELIFLVHVHIVHQYILVLSDEFERTGTLHGVGGLLLVVGRLLPVSGR